MNDIEYCHKYGRDLSDNDSKNNIDNNLKKYPG